MYVFIAIFGAGSMFDVFTLCENCIAALTDVGISEVRICGSKSGIHCLNAVPNVCLSGFVCLVSGQKITCSGAYSFLFLSV